MSLDFWQPALEVKFPIDVEGPAPVVVLIHGWGMSSFDYEWIRDHLASRGYAVASFNMWNPLLLGPDTWAPEVKRAIDALEKANEDGDLAGKLDLARLGVIGHSLGGATTIKLADTDPRVKAAVALAPGADVFTHFSMKASAERTAAPLLVMTGDLDFITPTDRAILDGHEAGKGDRQLVEVKGADHWSFTRWMSLWPFGSSLDQLHETAARFFTGWFDKHLVDKTDDAGLTDGRAAEKHRSEGKVARYDVKRTNDGLPLDVRKAVKEEPSSDSVKPAVAAAKAGRPSRTKGMAAALAEERAESDRARER